MVRHLFLKILHNNNEDWKREGEGRERERERGWVWKREREWAALLLFLWINVFSLTLRKDLNQFHDSGILFGNSAFFKSKMLLKVKKTALEVDIVSPQWYKVKITALNVIGKKLKSIIWSLNLLCPDSRSNFFIP